MGVWSGGCSSLCVLPCGGDAGDDGEELVGAEGGAADGTGATGAGGVELPEGVVAAVGEGVGAEVDVAVADAIEELVGVPSTGVGVVPDDDVGVALGLEG
jgi:hypothetical protein